MDPINLVTFDRITIDHLGILTTQQAPSLVPAMPCWRANNLPTVHSYVTQWPEVIHPLVMLSFATSSTSASSSAPGYHCRRHHRRRRRLYKLTRRAYSTSNRERINNRTGKNRSQEPLGRFNVLLAALNEPTGRIVRWHYQRLWPFDMRIAPKEIISIIPIHPFQQRHPHHHRHHHCRRMISRIFQIELNGNSSMNFEYHRSVRFCIESKRKWLKNNSENKTPLKRRFESNVEFHSAPRWWVKPAVFTHTVAQSKTYTTFFIVSRMRLCVCVSDTQTHNPTQSTVAIFQSLNNTLWLVVVVNKCC